MKDIKNLIKKFHKNCIKSSLEIIILMLIEQKSVSGFELIGLINEKFGILFSPSTIYPLLHTLKDYGLLSSIKKGKSIKYKIRNRQEVRGILHLHSGLIELIKSWGKIKK